MPWHSYQVHLGATSLAINFDKRDAFSFHPFLAAETGHQLRLFAYAAAFGNGFNTSDGADEFHRRSLVQRSLLRCMRYNACRSRPIPSSISPHQRSQTTTAMSINPGLHALVLDAVCGNLDAVATAGILDERMPAAAAPIFHRASALTHAALEALLGKIITRIFGVAQGLLDLHTLCIDRNDGLRP